jgi:hypothetical protein
LIDLLGRKYDGIEINPKWWINLRE